MMLPQKQLKSRQLQKKLHNSKQLLHSNQNHLLENQIVKWYGFLVLDINITVIPIAAI